MPPAIYEFGEFQLDCERFELRRGTHPIRLERKPLELLILLASSAGRLVTRDEIARLLWPTEVFVDTEHGINTAIRKIRYALRENPDHPLFLQTVTGKGYRFTGATTGASFTADHAPIPAPIPPQPSQPGATPPEPAVATGPIASPRTLWLTVSAAALALVLAAIIFGVHSIHARTGKPTITSIAVLPLDNLSGDPTQDYLADGMTDELTTMLAKNSSLRVISRTSVMQFKHARQPLPEIARQLHVDGILEGSLSRTGNNLHMTVQLIQAPTDTHIWAESYDRNADEALLLPQRVASSIAAATHSTLAPAVSHRYVNPAAHDAYLQGRFLWLNNNGQSALPWYQKAIALQPDYPRAWCGLSDYYALETMEGILDPRKSLALIDSTAQKCLQLDDVSQDSLGDLSQDDLLVKWNPHAALQEVSREIQQQPDRSEMYAFRAWILATLNRNDEAVQSTRQSLELDPAGGPGNLINALFQARRYDDVLTEINRVVDKEPSDPQLQVYLAVIYRLKGMDKESEAATENFYRASEGAPAAAALHNAFTHGGMKAALQWQIRFTTARAAKQYVSPVDFAQLYAQLGDRDHALAFLNEGLQQHAPAMLWIQNDADFDFLHTEPRYQAIVQKVGLPPAW